MRQKSLTSSRWISLTICGILLFSIPALAVSEAAVLFLLISPSTQANGMGETYGNLFDRDAAAVAFNPAALGLYAKYHYFGIGMNHSQWLPNYSNDFIYNHYHLLLGYDFSKSRHLPLAVGVGYQLVYLDWGRQYITSEASAEPTGSFKNWEKAHIFTAAASVDYYICGSIGVNFKSIHSHLLPYGLGIGDGEASASAVDIGMILQLPLWEMVGKISQRPRMSPHFKPVFTPSLFYSLRNVGEEISYVEGISDPLPRTAYVGAAIEMGMRYQSDRGRFDVFSVRCSREAEDMLIRHNQDGSFDYLSGLNEIRFSQDVLGGKSNSRVIVKKGWQFSLGEVVFIRTGRYEDGEGSVHLRTSGIGVNAMTPIKAMLAMDVFNLEDNLFKKLLLHLNVELHYSRYRAGTDAPLDETEYRCVTIGLENFTF